MQAQELYNQVAVRTGFALEQAADITRQTLASLTHVLPESVAQEVAPYLPPALGATLAGSEKDPLYDKELFIGPVMNALQTELNWDRFEGGLDLASVHSEEDARKGVRAVLATIGALVPAETFEMLEQNMPPGLL